jgi:hypothetical protein
VNTFQRAAPVLVMVLGFAAAPAMARELYKCKVEESRTVFHLDIGDDGQAQVSIGTLTAAAKLAYQGVPVIRDQATGTIEAEARVRHMVSGAGSGSSSSACLTQRNEYYLKMWPKQGNQYLGDLEVTPNFAPIVGQGQTCRGVPAPEVVTEIHKNVFCIKSAQ